MMALDSHERCNAEAVSRCNHYMSLYEDSFPSGFDGFQLDCLYRSVLTCEMTQNQHLVSDREMSHRENVPSETPSR
jgi:hypothetical protein